MPAGLDDISAVAGIVSCAITLLYGCVKGFELLCRARKSEVQMSSLRLMLEFEEQKLLAWAQTVGLLAHPPNLRIAVHHVNLVRVTLGNLCDLLNDGRKLRGYGLETESTAEVMLDIDNETALSRLDLVQRPGVQESLQATAHIFRSRTSPWHKLRWVAVDEQRFRRLLDDISRLIGHLQELLENDRAQVLRFRHDSLLRIAVMSTKNQQDLEFLSQGTQSICMGTPVGATARLKRYSLRLDIRDRFHQVRCGSMHQRTSNTTTAAPVRRSQTDIAATNDVDEMRLSLGRLRLPASPGLSESRQRAYYDCVPVLIEWRAIDPETWKLLKTRVISLASRLNAMDDPSFHSLPCRGYLRYQEAGLYGYVFELPASELRMGASVRCAGPQTEALPTLPHMQTLRALVSLPVSRPSLNVRVSCAIVLLETILQLHTAGWLHKELRSENILFFGLESDCGLQTDKLPKKMHVGGYVYARADSAYDFTEPAVPDVDSMVYRHPSSLGAIRLPYRKSFDIFSIGCILLELGLWSSLSDILSKYVLVGASLVKSESSDGGNMPMSPPQTPRTDGRDHDVQSRPGHLKRMRMLLEQIQSTSGQKARIIELLEGQTGRVYAEIVVECLTLGNRPIIQALDAEIQEQVRALEVEERSLNRLRRLAQVL